MTMQAFWLTAYEPTVQRELFRLGHRNLFMNAVADFILPCLVAASAWGEVEPATLWIWLAAALGGDAAAWLMWWAWRPTARLEGPVPSRRLRVWLWTHLTTVCLMAGSWGYAGVLYVPGNSVHNLLIITGFQGVLAYSAASNASHELLAFVVSLVLSGLIMTLYVPLALLHDSAYMVSMLWLFLGALCVVAYNAHQALLVSIRLRLANETLAAKNALIAAQAQQANRDKSEFLAAASHDLRQPVHAMVLLVEALRREEILAQTEPAAAALARRQTLVASIGDAAGAIGALFNGLMELSRLESGHHQLLPTPCHVAALLRQVMARHAGEHSGTSAVRLTLRVARRAESAWLDTDRVMLERIVANLLSNALRYTERGRVLVSLRARRDGSLMLTVHDTGCGIAVEHQARIFEPYVQLGNAERDRRQGLGLGLAIVAQCAHRLGVTLSLRSQAGHGAHFGVMIPAALRCQAPTGPSSETSADPLRPGALARRRLLLIDDDPMVRSAMTSLLTTWQVDLRCAHHGQDPVIERCAAEGWHPELLLCDYRLPGEPQGLDLLATLQERWPGSAALLQTGEPPERVQAAAEEAGYPVLYKPVSPAHLADTLLALLPTRSAV